MRCKMRVVEPAGGGGKRGPQPRGRLCEEAERARAVAEPLRVHAGALGLLLRVVHRRAVELRQVRGILGRCADALRMHRCAATPAGAFACSLHVCGHRPHIQDTCSTTMLSALGLTRFQNIRFYRRLRPAPPVTGSQTP